MKSVYILHQYGDPSHFKALYDEGEKHGLVSSEQIVLSRFSILKKAIRLAIKSGLQAGITSYFENMKKNRSVKDLEDQILIVGLAPYDPLLMKYEALFKRNHSYYFTSHCFWEGNDYSRGKAENKEEFERVLASAFEGAFCVSADCAESLAANAFPGPVSVVYHSIDYDDYKKRLDVLPRAKRFLFIGSLDDRKNVPLILEWLETNPSAEFSFSFIGDGEYKESICNISKSDKRIHYLGYKTKDELKETICGYDFVVLPSKREPFGIVLLEALAAGTPCIISDAPGMREIIQDGKNGFVFSLADEKSGFSEAMTRALSIDSEEEAQMRRSALSAGKQYATSSVIERWLALLKDEL